ncbi:MAG: hypothetical protein IKI74_06260 [Christensenellaceae bacterium]|nr:hypothetical protein [Christensenellaceae bacterium]
MLELLIKEDRTLISEALEEAGIRGARIKALFKSGSVKVDGKVKKHDAELKKDRTVTVDGIFPDFDVKGSVVYEDDNFFVMTKPSGMDVLTKEETGRDTLYMMAVRHMRETGQYEADVISVPYMIGDIDRDSSGLVIVAKDETMFVLLSGAVRERRIRMVMTIYAGTVPTEEQGDLTGYIRIKRNGTIEVEDSHDKGLIPAVVRYRVLESNMGASIIEAACLNGGTLMARAILGHKGIPVIGDEVYGDEKVNELFPVSCPSITVNRIVFETGLNNQLTYLNRKVIESRDIALPELRMRRRKE